MIKLATFAFLLISISVDTRSHSDAFQESVGIKQVEIGNQLTIKDEYYTLHFDIENNNPQPTLVISIELHKDSYFVSPNAKRDFKGKFYMDLGSYEHLDFDGDILETPRSLEEFDPHPFVNGLVNWVRVNTTYRQPLSLKSQDDFTVFGRIRFTIEPRCTLEEIPFGISFQNGAFKIIEAKC